MHVTGFYYIDYEDKEGDDAEDATTSMYVEVVLSENDLVTTFAVTVYTYKYVQRNFIATQKCLGESSFLLVPTVNGGWMSEYLDHNAEVIARIGDVV